MSSKQAEYHSNHQLPSIDYPDYTRATAECNGRMHRLQNVASLCEFGNKQKENL